MKPERWRQIEKLYDAALELDVSRRAAFLDQACKGDEELRREVASLLASDAQAGSFLAAPAVEVVARSIAAEPVSSPIGRRIGRYQVQSLLGAGGMGEIYLAQDTQLGRKVAIKLLPAKFTADTERVRRFAQEARAASALNHPNIITIHEIGEASTDAGSVHYIVTEYIEGETLRQRMASAPQQRIEPPEAIDIALQIAAALTAAHEAGITHRDIKPENVMVRRDGYVKVLDFGLAKLSEPLSSSRISLVDTQAVTLLREYNTRSGGLMGTPRYMSPEQLRGEKVDVRTDIFSLGVLLYEMVAGRPPFVGATTSDVIAAIIRDQPPPFAEDTPGAPQELELMISKALRKERAERYQIPKDFLADLKAMKQQVEIEAKFGRRNRQVVPAKAQTPVYPDPSSVGVAAPSFAKKVFSALAQSRRTLINSGLMITLLSLGVLGWHSWRASLSYLPSPQAKRYYDEGLNALRDGAYHKASKLFEEVISIDGDYAIPHARLAEAWMELDYTEKANYELRRAYALVTSRMAPIDMLYLQALNLTIEHKFTAAVEKYRAIEEQTTDGEKVYARLDLGRAHERNEEVEQAMNYYAQAKQHDPRYATAPLRLGILYSRQQEYEKARAEFDEAKKDYEALTNPEGLNEVLFQQGVLLGRRGQLREAREVLQLAHDKAREIKNLSQQIAALLQLSLISYEEGKTVPARERAQEALDLARVNGLENLTTQGLIDIGNAFYQRREYEEAEKHLNDALDFAESAKGRRLAALAHLSLGRLYIQQEIRLDEAMRHLERALTFFQKGGYRKEIEETISLLGRARLPQGDYAEALQIFDEQLQRAKQVNDQSQLARLHALIGRTLADQEIYQEALLHFEESYSIYQSLGSQLLLGYALLDRSDILWRLGRYQESRSWLSQVPPLVEHLDSQYKQIIMARMHLINAAMLLSERRFSEAIAECRRTLALADTPTMYLAIEAKYLLGLAIAMYSGKRQAKQFCDEAIETATKMGYLTLSWNARLALAQVLIEIGNPAEAMTGALQAHDEFARAGKLESQWRAACLVARASYLTNDHSSARKHTTQAESLLSSLRQKLAEEAFKSYSARPDIDQFRKQLRTVSTSI
jgi:serine/threonine protein kinase/Tfp pilus assembly protein PilF